MRALYMLLILSTFNLNLFADSFQKELRINAANTEVLPGEVVPLSLENHAPVDFLWVSEDLPEAVCDLYSSSVCIAETHFQVTPAGVQFKVPNTFTAPITIVARERGGELTGSITLYPRVTPAQTYYINNPPPVSTSVVFVQRPWHSTFWGGPRYWEPYGHLPHWHHEFHPIHWERHYAPVYHSREGRRR